MKKEFHPIKVTHELVESIVRKYLPVFGEDVPMINHIFTSEKEIRLLGCTSAGQITDIYRNVLR